MIIEIKSVSVKLRENDPMQCLPDVAVDSGEESVKIVRFLRVQFPHYPG